MHEILTKAEPDDGIEWGATGSTLIITDQVKFARNVLPRYFKHDKVSSFTRQLYLYGFNRCHHSANAGIADAHGRLEFGHDFFVAGRKDLLELITRRSVDSEAAKRREMAHALAAGPPPHLAPFPNPMAPPNPPNVEVPGQAAHAFACGDMGHLQMANELMRVRQQMVENGHEMQAQAQRAQSSMAALAEMLAGATCPVPPLGSECAHAHCPYAHPQPYTHVHPAAMTSAWGAAMPQSYAAPHAHFAACASGSALQPRIEDHEGPVHVEAR